MNDLISVVVPIYRVEKYLEKCLDSIIMQTYTNIEILLVDDGSDDACPEICEIYARRDKRVKVFHKENEGLSSARNVGIDNARGKYITFIDSDDYIDLRFVEILHKLLINNNCDIAKCGNIKVCDDYAISDIEKDDFAIYSPVSFLKSMYTHLESTSMTAWGKMYDLRLFTNIRYPIGKNHEDEYVTYKLVYNANRIVNTMMRLYYYRQRVDSIMGQNWSLKRLDALEALQDQESYYHSIDADRTLIRLSQARLKKYIDTNLNLAIKSGCAGTELIQKMYNEKNRIEDILMEDDIAVPGMNNRGCLFPYDRINKDDNVILYGAGERGNVFYRQILLTNYCNIVAWVDANESYYQEIGYPVVSMKSIEYKGEKVVLAIGACGVAQQIIEMLIKDYKIPRENIVYELYDY